MNQAKLEILDALAGLLAASLPPRTRRRPQTRADFGDAATIGAFLRRHPWPGIDRADPSNDFAMYDGQTEHGYTVSVRPPLGQHATRYEYYETAEAMRREWELD